MRRLLLWSVLGFIVLVPIALVLAVVACLEEQPRLARAAQLTPEQVARARRILKTHDPRNARTGALRSSRKSLAVSSNSSVAEIAASSDVPDTI